MRTNLFDSLGSFVVLVLATYALVLSISIVEGRIQDLQQKELRLQQYNQEISVLSSVGPEAQISPTLEARIGALQGESQSYENKIDEADGTIAFGSAAAWGQTSASYFSNPANYFHGMSSETNLLVIGVLSCVLGYAAGRMYLHSQVTMYDLGLSALTGIIAVLAIKGARSFVADPTASGVDVTDPYGIALFAAFAGLYTNKFYAYLQKMVDGILKDPAVGDVKKPAPDSAEAGRQNLAPPDNVHQLI